MVRDFTVKNGPLFLVFQTNKHHHNFYNKYMWKNIHPVFGPRIRTHNMSLPPPITTGPGLLPCVILLLPFRYNNIETKVKY